MWINDRDGQLLCPILWLQGNQLSGLLHTLTCNKVEFLKGEDNGRSIDVPNDDTKNYFFYWLQFVVESFRHSIKLTNQPKFNESDQGC